jgi:hypothetical protein
MRKRKFSSRKEEVKLCCTQTLGIFYGIDNRRKRKCAIKSFEDGGRIITEIRGVGNIIH